MFGTIRKHQSWLWFIIIGVMIIGMITWTNQLGKSGNGRGGGSFGVIDGHTVTATDYQDAANEAIMMYAIQNDQWPDTARGNFDEQRETYQRMFLARKLDEYNIHIDRDAVAQFASVVLREFAKGQSLNMDDFVNGILKPHNLTVEDFQRTLEHYLGIQQLISVVGISGKLVTPQELQSLYTHEYQQIAVDAVFFSASNYLAKIPEPTPAELGEFYTNEEAQYREPDQIQLRYVLFNVTNFVPEAEQQIGITNLNEQAAEALTRLGTNGLRYGKTPDEAREKIAEVLAQKVAISNAYTKAVAFQNEMNTTTNGVAGALERFATLAKEQGLEVKTSKPFDRQYGPTDLNLGDYPFSALFNLTPEAPFVERPIPGGDGVYIVVLDKFMPSRIPSLSEIHSRVVADYKMSRALQSAQINGSIFGQTVTNQLVQGKTFASAAAAAKQEPITVTPFSLGTQELPQVEDQVDINTFKQVAFTTPVGKASSFIPTPAGGFVVYAREKLPIDEARMKAALPQFANVVRQRREMEAFNLWYMKEYQLAMTQMPPLKEK